MNRMNRIIIAVVLIMATVSTRAELYSFYSLGNDTNGVAGPIGVAQLSVDVTVQNTTTASFLFANVGPDDNSVAKICFDFYPAVSPGLVSTYPDWWDVAMNTGGNQLPGAGGWFMSDICLTPNPPPTKNGLITGTTLEVILSYDDGFDILAALDNTELRIGLHVISMGEGQDSESFINNIPEPASLVLLLGTSSMFAFIRRRFIA